MTTTIISNGVNRDLLWSRISVGKGDASYLKNIGSSISNWLDREISYLKTITPTNIVGGAKALWENLSKGNWGFFKDWAGGEDSTLIARASGISAVLLGVVAGVKTVGSIGAKIAATSFGKFAAGAGIATLFTRTELVEKTFNFAEKAVEVNFNRSTDKFFADSVKALGEVAKSIATDLISLGGRSLARVIVDQVGKVYLKVNRRMLGILSLVMSKEIWEDIKSSIAGICSRLWSFAKSVASEGILLMGRDLLASFGIVNKPTDKEEFTLSDKIEKDFKVISEANNIPEWLQEALSEGAEEFYETFRETLTERAGIIDLARQGQIEFEPY